LWSITTRRLVNSFDLGEVRLSVVALHQCVNYAWLLVTGKRGVDLNADARSDCPLDLTELERLRERLRQMRDEVLHLSDKTEHGHFVNTSWTRDEPFLTVSTSVSKGRAGEVRQDSISRTEVETLLDRLDPWLKRHHHRLIGIAVGE